MVVLGGGAVSYERGSPVLEINKLGGPAPKREDGRAETLLEPYRGTLARKKAYPPRTLP